jgi:hypothetical protein
MAAGGSLVLKAIKRYLGQAGNLAVRKYTLTTQRISLGCRSLIEVVKTSTAINQC